MQFQFKSTCIFFLYILYYNQQKNDVKLIKFHIKIVVKLKNMVLCLITSIFILFKRRGVWHNTNGE